MKPFNIPFLTSASGSPQIEQVSMALDQQEKHPINIIPWPLFSYKPDVVFSIGHDGNNIFLKYYVQENAVAAVHRKTNGPVYKDSCVELFIDFNDEQGYYNVEFNCAGTGHVGFGKAKDNRALIPGALVEEIKYQALFTTATSKAFPFKWELSLIIPLGVFCYHELGNLNNKACRVNFYKCGDELPVPHYLSWAEMSSAEPNFHLPQFFGDAQFLEYAIKP